MLPEFVILLHGLADFEDSQQVGNQARDNQESTDGDLIPECARGRNNPRLMRAGQKSRADTSATSTRALVVAGKLPGPFGSTGPSPVESGKGTLRNIPGENQD